MTQKPIERIALLHTTEADITDFAARVQAAAKLDESDVLVMTVGPSVGPHLGPGCVGGVALYKS